MTRIAEIVDYSAALAAVQVEGIAATFGAGSGLVDDPLRSGEKVRPAPGAPTQPFEHWSEVGQMTASEWETQDGAQRLTWVIPMRLWMARSDLGRLRQDAQPFFAAYWQAFTADPTLGGLAAVSRLTRMEVGDDPPRADGRARWGWLDVTLEAEEITDPYPEPS